MKMSVPVNGYEDISAFWQSDYRVSSWLFTGTPTSKIRYLDKQIDELEKGKSDGEDSAVNTRAMNCES
jgi:hypothetical protein